jgi:hypothetical protein
MKCSETAEPKSPQPSKPTRQNMNPSNASDKFGTKRIVFMMMHNEQSITLFKVITVQLMLRVTEMNSKRLHRARKTTAIRRILFLPRGVRMTRVKNNPETYKVVQ